MGKFAFIFHPHDIESLGDWVLLDLELKRKKRRTAERALRWLPPFRRDTVTGLKSLTGKTSEGEMILLPLVPEQILQMDEKVIIKKMIEAGKIAEDLGAKVVGLGAYAAWVGKKGVLLAKALNIAVTTGTSYTIVTAVYAILKAAKDIGIDLAKAKVAVLGATGTIGSISSYMLANHISHLTLIAQNKERLKNLAESIAAYKPSLNINICSDVKSGVKDADITLIVTNTPKAIIDIADLSSGSVACDLSLPHNISQEKAESRNDVLVIDGGVVKPPGDVDFHFNFGLPPGLAYACMSETMILALEGLYQSYSLGGDITLEKVTKMAELGEKHGFRLAEFRSFGNEVSKAHIEDVKKSRLIAGK